MSAHPPPVPPEQRPPHGGASADPKQEGVEHATHDNPVEKGQAGNIAQNTTNKGHQQDR